MTIEFDVQDHPTLPTIDVNQPNEGSLVLPAARDLRLTLTGIGHHRPGYFANPEARVGASVNIDLRAVASVESQLLAEPKVFPSLRSFFFQPPPADGSVASPVERLAAELNLDRTGLTLSGRPDSPHHHRLLRAPPSYSFTRGICHYLLVRGGPHSALGQRRPGHAGTRMDLGRPRPVTRVVHLPTGDTQEVVGAITLPRALAQQVRGALPADPGQRRAPRSGSRPSSSSSMPSIPSPRRASFPRRSPSTTFSSRPSKGFRRRIR